MPSCSAGKTLDLQSLVWKKPGFFHFNNVVCGGETVSFYAVDRAYENKLKQSLLQFSTVLPKTIQQSGPYILLGMKASKSF